MASEGLLLPHRDSAKVSLAAPSRWLNLRKCPLAPRYLGARLVLGLLAGPVKQFGLARAERRSLRRALRTSPFITHFNFPRLRGHFA